MLKKLIVGAIVANCVIMLASIIVPTAVKYEQQTAEAQNTTAQYLASCTVTPALEINAVLKEMLPDGSDIVWTSTPASMDFGTLSAVEDVNGTTLYMGGAKSYAVVMFPATSGRQYNLQFTGEVLTGSAGGTIGDGADAVVGSTQDAYVVVPDYQWLDVIGSSTQGAPPTGALVGDPARISTASSHILYSSGPAGFTRAVRAYIGVGGPSEAGKISSWTLGHNGATGQGTEKLYNKGSAWDLVQPDQKAGTYTGDVTFTLTLS